MITFNCPKAILPLSLFLILSDDKGLNNDNLILMGMQSDVGHRYQENGLASFFATGLLSLRQSRLNGTLQVSFLKGHPV